VNSYNSVADTLGGTSKVSDSYRLISSNGRIAGAAMARTAST
jgi:hypothetical protein